MLETGAQIHRRTGTSVILWVAPAKVRERVAARPTRDPTAISAAGHSPGDATLTLVPESPFYSDRAGFQVPRVSEDVSEKAWKGLVALLRSRIGDGSLARDFPLQECPDGQAITGTNERLFLDSLEAHIPGLAGSPLEASQPQNTVITLDIVDFVALHIDQPTYRRRHDWGSDHTHFYFDDQHAGLPSGALTDGQAQFQSDIDLLFARNGIAFTLGDDMRVRRLGPPEARPLLSDFQPNTGDPNLDSKLNDAVARFVSRNPVDRQDAVEKLWDSFERLKTLEGGQKKQSATKLIENATIGFEPFREPLDAEFKALTDIGNGFQIRHHEHGKAELPGSAGIDYLFIRLAALISYVLRRTGRMS